MNGHLQVLALRQDVDQVGGRHEVEARELLPLRLQVVGERALAQVEPGDAQQHRRLAPRARRRPLAPELGDSSVISQIDRLRKCLKTAKMQKEL